MEIFQEYGNDLVINNRGDLAAVDSVELSNQRIIRRFLTAPITVTNPPDYLDHPTYGAGLPQFIGRIATPEVYEEISGVITSQMYLEDSVSQTPPPVIEITGLPNRIDVAINYTHKITNQQAVLNFTVNA